MSTDQGKHAVYTLTDVGWMILGVFDNKNTAEHYMQRWLAKHEGEMKVEPASGNVEVLSQWRHEK